MATPRDTPYVWTTWITKLIAGEVHCEWAAWFRAHYTYDKIPSTFNSAKWTAEHAAMVREQTTGWRADGYSVFVEEQNAFKLPGKSGVTLAGKPDLIALREETVYIIDCKTGLPRHADQIQVLIYMLVLPYVRPAWKHRTLSGRVQYRQDTVDISAPGVDAQFRTLFRRTMAQVSGTAALPRVPSYAECRFCDITRHDCPQRIEVPPLEIEPEHDLF
jgi:hypothetical protein